MCEDSDQEISDLDIETRTWNKFEKNMKSIGFREGAAKGRDISLQEGFNLGYLDGFKIGEYLGMIRGVFSCRKELGVSTKDFHQKVLTNEPCVLCPKDKTSLNQDFEKLESIISRQQIHNNEVITTLEKLDFDPMPTSAGQYMAKFP